MSHEKLKDIRLYNHSVFVSQKTPRREKILMSIVDEKLKLKPSDETYKNVLIQAFTIMSEYPELKKQLKLIAQIDGGKSLATCYTIVNDAMYVFGNIQETNRMYLKNAQRERLLGYIRKLKQAAKIDYKLVLLVEKLLMDLDDLPKALPGEKVEEQEYIIPHVEFTSNPSALIEEAQYDEEE